MRRHARAKLLGSLRGTGRLRGPAGETRVDYEIDRYDEGGRRRADGSLSGDLSPFADQSPEEALILVLEDGREISVLLANPASDGADITAEGDVADA